MPDKICNQRILDLEDSIGIKILIAIREDMGCEFLMIGFRVRPAAGSNESPEFQRQAKDYARAVAQSEKQTKVIVGETYNHFDIVETLGSPYGLLGRTLLDFVNDRNGEQNQSDE